MNHMQKVQDAQLLSASSFHHNNNHESPKDTIISKRVKQRMLEERMIIVERCLQESELREIEAEKLKRSSAKIDRKCRSDRTEYTSRRRKSWKL